MPDVDALTDEAHALASRLNALLQHRDADVALVALAHLIGVYLATLPIEDREDELQDWLRLVRGFAKMRLFDA